eukprot:TRINITY_DN656_c0_g1_i6.p1 TRINITY_DN656_c0_g1~~TRINITY_DN656_c0_g1_i6.p1  ORF type:complete len:700 (-),score=205.70 TRINITY_DN656_c0_g1_i6:1512-3488(-)
MDESIRGDISVTTQKGEEELKISLERIKHLETELFEKKEEMIEREKKIEENVLLISELRSEITTLERSKSALVSELDTLDGQLNDMKENILENDQHHHDELEEKVVSLKRLENELSESQSKLDRHLIEKKESEDHFGSIINTLEKERDFLREQCDTLTSDLALSKEAHEKATSHLTSVLEGKVQDHQLALSMLEELKREKSTLEKTLQEIHSEEIQILSRESGAEISVVEEVKENEEKPEPLDVQGLERKLINLVCQFVEIDCESSSSRLADRSSFLQDVCIKFSEKVILTESLVEKLRIAEEEGKHQKSIVKKDMKEHFSKKLHDIIDSWIRVECCSQRVSARSCCTHGYDLFSSIRSKRSEVGREEFVDSLARCLENIRYESYIAHSSCCIQWVGLFAYAQRAIGMYEMLKSGVGKSLTVLVNDALSLFSVALNEELRVHIKTSFLAEEDDRAAMRLFRIIYRHFVGIIAPISSECVVHVARALAHAIDQSLISCLCEEESKFSSAMSGLKMKMRVSMFCEWLTTMLSPHLPNDGHGFNCLSWMTTSREVSNMLLLPKTFITAKDLLEDVCPHVSASVLFRILSSFQLDSFDPDGPPPKLLRDLKSMGSYVQDDEEPSFIHKQLRPFAQDEFDSLQALVGDEEQPLLNALSHDDML